MTELVSSENQMTERVPVYMTTAQKAEIRANCGSLPMGVFLRDLGLNNKQKLIEIMVSPEVISGLDEIETHAKNAARSHNQIARNTNIIINENSYDQIALLLPNLETVGRCESVLMQIRDDILAIKKALMDEIADAKERVLCI
jgi:hypothetical protein